MSHIHLYQKGSTPLLKRKIEWFLTILGKDIIQAYIYKVKIEQ